MQSARGCSRFRRLCGSRRSGQARVDPAAMDAVVQRFRRLRIGVALTDETAERRLDMAAWAAEPIIEVEMPERRIEIVHPESADHPSTEPDAFGIGGGT